jgi:hypothetical protein
MTNAAKPYSGVADGHHQTLFQPDAIDIDARRYVTLDEIARPCGAAKRSRD